MFRTKQRNHRKCSYFGISLEYSVPELQELLQNILPLWHMNHPKWHETAKLFLFRHFIGIFCFVGIFVIFEVKETGFVVSVKITFRSYTANCTCVLHRNSSRDFLFATPASPTSSDFICLPTNRPGVECRGVYSRRVIIRNIYCRGSPVRPGANFC